MSGYEHLMTLGSFVIALGIGSILNFAAVLAHHRRTAKVSAAHLLWVGAILFNQMSFWLGSFLFHNETHADVYMLSYVVISPILLYAQGALAVTDGREDMDLVNHNERNRRIYLSLILISIVVDSAFFTVMHDTRPDIMETIPGWRLDTTLAQNGVMAACVTAGLAFRGRIQLGAATLYFLMRAISMALSSIPLLQG